MTTSTEIRNELVVVTGASTGIGAATARHLAARGFHVLAGVRRPNDAEQLRGEHVEPLILDITVEADVAAIAERVTHDPEHRPLRAVVNNAGIALSAPVETLPLAEWRRQFDVNLFGHIAVTQALLPALIESYGTVVNISSVGGKVAMATYGAYAGAKFALEAVSDALRREVAPFGVKVAVVEPGAVITHMAGRGIATAHKLATDMTPEQHTRYDALIGAITTQADSFTTSGVPAERAAGIIAKAVTAEKQRPATPSDATPPSSSGSQDWPPTGSSTGCWPETSNPITPRPPPPLRPRWRPREPRNGDRYRTRDAAGRSDRDRHRHAARLRWCRMEEVD